MKPTSSPIVLLTGFEPFGGEVENPSEQIAQSLHGGRVGDCRVESLVLPVTFADALPRLLEAMAVLEPRLIVCLGQGGGEDAIRVERVALNLADARIPDNAGAEPNGEAVVAGGPVAYWSTLPIAAMVSAIVEQGVAARVSNSAGTFVCNHVFYGLMHALATSSSVRGGFVHVPFTPEQAVRAGASASMPVAEMTAAIRAAIEACIEGD